MIQRIVNGGSCAGYCHNCCLQLTIFVHAASIVNHGVSCKVHAHVCNSKPLDHSLLYMHAAHFTCIALSFRFTMEEQAIVLDWAAYTIVGLLDRLESLPCHVTSHCSSDPTVTKMIEDSTLTSEAQVCVVCYQPIHPESQLRVLVKLEQDPSFKFPQPMMYRHTVLL